MVDREDSVLLKINDKLVWQASTEKIDFYKTFIEDQFLRKSENYFLNAANDLAPLIGTEDYFIKAKQLFETEEKLVGKLLRQSTLELLKTKLLEQILSSFQINYHQYQANFHKIFEEKNLKNLSKLYNDFSSDPNMTKIFLIQIEVYLKYEGCSIIDQGKKLPPKECVKTFIDFSTYLDQIVVLCFKNNEEFVTLKETACKNVINSRIDLAVYSAIYCDEVMKSDVIGIHQEELNIKFDGIVDIISNMSEKDLFFSNYAKFLGARLLDGTATSKEAELQLVLKFKEKIGSIIIDKLISMIQDIDTSTALGFKYAEARQFISNFDFDVKIIRNGGWPEQETEPIIMPREINVCLEDFKSFYLKLHDRRKLI